ncbi:hypothetical protein [Mastigocladopsis repens]|uniref:hypothetical protein n=1 Tax=Mastigocladopsis repens TaxID=221287 RepID=UPI0002E0B1FF|nr:hypothetical protein [Mastigocladopsis repens]
MTSTINMDTTDELEYGTWISLKNVQMVPFSIDKFWSAFDDYLTFLNSFSGRTNVELETGFGKPKNTPGAIVRFDFMGSIVRDRLLLNDKKNHVWRMDIPEATPLFTLYNVTFSAREVGDQAEVTIIVEFVLQSENRSERAEALKTLKEFLPKRIPEIVKFIQERDGNLPKLAPVTESEIRELVTDFYAKLDAHAPVEEYDRFFAFDEEGFKMQFPSQTLHNRQEFKQWYESSVNLYFDEIHQLKEINVSATSEQAEVKAIVHWEGSVWKAPASHSQRTIADADHSWVVKRSPQTYKPVFKSYIVHKLNLADTSAKPEVPAVH